MQNTLTFEVSARNTCLGYFNPWPLPAPLAVDAAVVRWTASSPACISMTRRSTWTCHSVSGLEPPTPGGSHWANLGYYAEMCERIVKSKAFFLMQKMKKWEILDLEWTFLLIQKETFLSPQTPSPPLIAFNCLDYSALQWKLALPLFKIYTQCWKTIWSHGLIYWTNVH